MIEHVLAVVAVRDIDSARDWYARLFDRRPDNHPMRTLVEWQLAPAAWLQVTVDSERAGSSMFNVAVAELELFVHSARSRGIDFGNIVDANKGVELSTASDPDGNSITALGGFREHY